MAAGEGDDSSGPWAREAIDLTRAAAAGLLFGTPLLFTMEVWWTGTHTEPATMLAVLAATAVPVLVLNRTQGFRPEPDLRWRDAAVDTVETLAVAFVLTFAVLVLLAEVDGDTPGQVVLGKLVYESVAFAVGIGVAQHFLRGGRLGDEDDERPARKERSGANATLADLGATAIGAIFVALNIAPTDEVPMLAAAMDPPRLVALVAASLLASYAIVFEGGFAKQDQRRRQPGLFQHPVTETAASYIVALGMALLMLALFQRVDGPWSTTLGFVVVLGFPAAVGGAAGRLAV